LYLVWFFFCFILVGLSRSICEKLRNLKKIVNQIRKMTFLSKRSIFFESFEVGLNVLKTTSFDSFRRDELKNTKFCVLRPYLACPPIRKLYPWVPVFWVVSKSKNITSQRKFYKSSTSLYVSYQSICIKKNFIIIYR